MPITVSPNKLASYLVCPRRCGYEWQAEIQGLRQENVDPGHINYRIARKAIKWTYMEAARTGYIPTWKMISKFIDRAYRELITGEKFGGEEVQFVEAASVMGTLQRWQQDFYQDHKCSGLGNVPIKLNLDGEIIYEDQIELVLFENAGISLLDFTEKQTNNATALYNDPVAQIRIWGWWKFTEDLPKHYYRLGSKPESMSSCKINVLQSVVERTEMIVRQATRGIRDEVWAPAFGKECKGCSWLSRCEW